MLSMCVCCCRERHGSQAKRLNELPFLCNMRARAADEASAGRAGSSSDAFWERQLQMKMEMMAQLQAQLDGSGREAAEATARHDAAVARLQNQLTAAVMASERLEREIAKRPEARELQVRVWLLPGTCMQ